MNARIESESESCFEDYVKDLTGRKDSTKYEKDGHNSLLRYMYYGRYQLSQVSLGTLHPSTTVFVRPTLGPKKI